MSPDADTPTIPGYELTTPLGEGGQASVFLGMQLSMHRPVAVKVILPGAGEGSTELGRFLREARVLARMRHENIVQAIDFGEADGVRYLVMEHVDGTTVQDLIKENTGIGIARACDISLQVSRALEHASQFDVIHRDIKPANIIITEKGRAVLVDFGLARPEEGDPDLQVTMAGMSVGTPHYMPPEQIRGVDKLDQRVDIYGLGGTFYHMLTGRPPFQKRDKTQILIAHLKEPVVLPEELSKEIPDYVFAIVLKSMEKNRDKRYQNPDEMARDLEKAINRLKGVEKRPRRRVEAAAPTPTKGRHAEKVKADRERLSKEVEALKERQEEIRKKAQEIIHRKNRELEQGRAQVLALQEKLDLAQSGSESTDTLKESLQKLEDENKALGERLTGAEGFIREFEKKAQTQEESATRQLEELARERDLLREKLEDGESRVAETRTLVGKTEQERDRLRTERDGLRRRVEELEAGGSAPAPSADDDLARKLAAAQTAVSLLESERDELKNNRRMLRVRLDEMGEKLRDMEVKRDTERRDLTEQIRQAEALVATQEALPVVHAEEEEEILELAEAVEDGDDISGELSRELMESTQRFEEEKGALVSQVEHLTAERDQALAKLAEREQEEDQGAALAAAKEELAELRAKSAEKLEQELSRAGAEAEERLKRETERLRTEAEESARQGADKIRAEAEESARREAEKIRAEAEERLEQETEKVRAEVRSAAPGPAVDDAAVAEFKERAETAEQEAAAAAERLSVFAKELEKVREEADRGEAELRERLTELVRENRDLRERIEMEEEPEQIERVLGDAEPETVDIRTEPPKDAVVPARNSPMAFISRGEFIAGVDEGANMDTPRRTVNVASFWIDVYPVTNRQYAEFVKATGRAPPPHWNGPEAPFNFVDHPVVQVTWADANAFAKWCGKRLPTPVEWQKAARGTDGRTFPWGDEWETHRLNSKEEGPNRTSPVGIYRRGPSPYGVYDVAGNVTEWVEGEFKTSGSQIIRPVCSGSWRDVIDRSQCAARRGYPDGGKAPYVGFRCARNA